MSHLGGIATQVAAEPWRGQGWHRQRAHRHPWPARAMYWCKLRRAAAWKNNLRSFAVQIHARFGTKCPHGRGDLVDCEGYGRSTLMTLGTFPAACRLSPDGKESRSLCQILNLKSELISVLLFRRVVKGNGPLHMRRTEANASSAWSSEPYRS
jgi:hypothetical protein